MFERILVTGGVGFIGTHLVDALLKRHPDKQIEIVDDLSSSTLTSARKKFFEKNQIDFVKVPVAEWNPKSGYGQIYHLACKVGPAHVIKYGGKLSQEIISDSVKVAELAISERCPLLCISTSEVYGREPSEPQGEASILEVPPTFSPRLEYAVAKMLSEIALLNWSRQNEDLIVNFVRPFNIVGPGQRKEGGFVLPSFVEWALEDKPLNVFGNGSQLRSFTHVADIVEALILIMESKVNQKIYNIGTPFNTISIMTLAKRVIKLAKSKSKIVLVDPQKIFGGYYTNAPSKIPDISAIVNDLEWNPNWCLDEIILDCIEYTKRRN